MHECGQPISFSLTIAGHSSCLPVVAMREGCFTFSTPDAEPHLHFKAHGTRIKYCPKCKKPLPKTVEELSEK